MELIQQGPIVSHKDLYSIFAINYVYYTPEAKTTCKSTILQFLKNDGMWETNKPDT